METTRRGFLRSTSLGTAGAWIAQFLPRAVHAQESVRKSFDPRIKHNFLSVCRQCPQGCGVLAEVVDHKIKKLRGNPMHPTNRGTLCARGVSATQLHYNPDRVRGPLRRKGDRGGGEWEAIGWEEALGQLADELLSLRQAGKSNAFAVLAEQLGGLEGILTRRFCQAFGSPNFLEVGQYPSASVNAASVMQGIAGPIIFDIRNATHLVSFNVPFLETSRNPIQTWKGFAEFRSGEGRPRGRYTHFSPARDLTAAKADEWVPIKPGTEGAVALGMAYVMLKEGLYDHEFVRLHCQGFEEQNVGGGPLPGFHAHVLQNYSPARVAEISGAPVDKIVGIAREFALAQAPLALWQEQVGIASQPLSAQMAIHSLNALVGNIDAPGGILVPRELPTDLSAALVQDSVSREGLARGSVVAEALSSTFPTQVLNDSPYPIEVLVVYRANPVFDHPDRGKYRGMFQKIPFSVCVASFHNDTTQWCDLVLPEGAGLESWYAGINYTDAGHPFFNLAEPVVPPRYDTRHFGDVMLALARRCGSPTAESLPWSRFQDVAAAYIGQLNELQFGDVFGRPYEEIWTRLLERIGWRGRLEGSNAEFWRASLKAGGWWDPIYFHNEWPRAFQTASGRFEFFPRTLWEQEQRRRGGQPMTPADKVQVLPHYAPEQVETDADFPFALLVHALPHLNQVESPNQPWLQEISGDREREHWTTWLDMNAEEAELHQLHHGDPVWVESAQGKAQVHCRPNHGVQPGTVRIAFGLGHVAGGRWMESIGASPVEVVASAFDTRAGTPNWQATRVRIRKG